MTVCHIINPPLTQITNQCFPRHHLLPNTNPNPNLFFSLFRTNPLCSRHTLQLPPLTPTVTASLSTCLLCVNHHLLAQSRQIAHLRQPPPPREPLSSCTISPARQPLTTTTLALAPSRHHLRRLEQPQTAFHFIFFVPLSYTIITLLENSTISPYSHLVELDGTPPLRRAIVRNATPTTASAFAPVSTTTRAHVGNHGCSLFSHELPEPHPHSLTRRLPHLLLCDNVHGSTMLKHEVTTLDPSMAAPPWLATNPITPSASTLQPPRQPP